jgi:A/G-specific adenine glycosylase
MTFGRDHLRCFTINFALSTRDYIKSGNMDRKKTKQSPPRLSDNEIRSIRRRLLRWGKNNFKNFPWRRTDKLWHALAAEVLLQRTRAGTVAVTYNKFVSAYQEPAQLATAPLREIKKLLYPLGLPTRAVYLKKLAVALTGLNAIPPESLEELGKLPGIGSYAAAAYRSLHLRKYSTIIDANVVRWICRLVGQECDGETRRKQWLKSLAEQLTPARNTYHYNYAVLDFTLDICSTQPKCGICPIGPKYCIYGRDWLKKPGRSLVREKA